MSAENEGFGSESCQTPETCVICLQDITNKCHTITCLHMFCYKCLIKWSTKKPSCPLCVRQFDTIVLESTNECVDNHKAVRGIRRFKERCPADVMVNTFIHNGNGTFVKIPSQPRSIPHGIHVQGERRQVYENNIWSYLMPQSTTRLRICYNDITKLLRKFIHRDIFAIRIIGRLKPLCDWTQNDMKTYEQYNYSITDMVLNLFPVIEMKSMATELQPYLEEHAEHFCHELFVYVNSLCSIETYDRSVRYRKLPEDQFQLMNNIGVIELQMISGYINIHIINNKLHRARHRSELIIKLIQRFPDSL